MNHDPWAEALSECGINRGLLIKKGTPCPACGGTDRFTYDNHFAKGDSFCRSCGHMTAIDLLMKAKNIEAGDALKQLREAGAPIPKPIQAKTNHKAIQAVEQNKNHALMRVALERCVPASGTDAERYLQARGVDLPPNIERFQCLFTDSYEKYNEPTLPAMVWRVFPVYKEGQRSYIMRHNEPSLLHATRLEGTHKASSVDSAKVFSNAWVSDKPAYQMTPVCSQPSNIIILAEGIETTIAAHHLMAWHGVEATALSMLNTTNMAKFFPTDKMFGKQFYVFADRDSSYAGQLAAIKCAKNITSLTGDYHSAKIIMPDKVDTDWLDVWNSGGEQFSLREW